MGGPQKAALWLVGLWQLRWEEWWMVSSNWWRRWGWSERWRAT